MPTTDAIDLNVTPYMAVVRHMATHARDPYDKAWWSIELAFDGSLPASEIHRRAMKQLRDQKKRK